MNTDIEKFGKYSFTSDKNFAIEYNNDKESIESEYLFITPTKKKNETK